MPMRTLETRPDGALVIEADTAAEGLAEVSARLGDDAEIIAAEKVHRGGWHGFFTREVVQLTARARGGASVPQPAAPPMPGGIDASLSQMTREADEREGAFRDLLVRQLTEVEDETDLDPAPPAVPAIDPDQRHGSRAPVTAPERAPSLPVPERPSSPGCVAWDVAKLEQLHLPAAIVDACRDLDPRDDVAWLLAIADAVSSWCRPLPSRDVAYVGPRAHRLAAGLGLPHARPGALVPDQGSVGLRTTDTPGGRAWVDEVAGGRWRHLVAGGTRWQALVFDDPTAVSWVGDGALVGALDMAARLGLVLGYGLTSATGPAPVRATPVDVAVTIRWLLPRHAA